MKIVYRISQGLVWIANQLIEYGTPTSPSYYPLYRPVDTVAPNEKWACGAYSLEGLRSFVEQDGPNGFGATATVKWLISDEGWKSFNDMTMNEVRRELAMIGIDMEDEDELPQRLTHTGANDE